MQLWAPWAAVIDCMVHSFVCVMQLAERDSQLSAASQRQAASDHHIRQLHAELADKGAAIQTMQAKVEGLEESQAESALVDDLDRLLSDPDHLPLEAEELMSSLRREVPANPDWEASGQLQRLRKQLQAREEELQKRDSAMQQLLRGAERIEEAQMDTLQRLAEAQTQVGLLTQISTSAQCPSLQSLAMSSSLSLHM